MVVQVMFFGQKARVLLPLKYDLLAAAKGAKKVERTTKGPFMSGVSEFFFLHLTDYTLGLLKTLELSVNSAEFLLD